MDITCDGCGNNSHLLPLAAAAASKRPFEDAGDGTNCIFPIV